MGRKEVGYRLWKFRVRKDCRGLLKEFQEQFKYKTWLYLYSLKFNINVKVNKYSEYYVPEISRVLWNSVLLRGNGGVKIYPMLKVKFVENSKVLHGSIGAPVIVDLSKKEVRFKRRVLAEIPQSTVKAIKEDIRRFKELKFIVQFTKEVHLIAFHDYRKPFINSMPFLVITIDVNSRHGFTVRGFLFRDGVVKIVSRLSLRPPNHSLRWKEVRKLQHLHDVSRKYEYYRLLRAIHNRIRRLNSEFKMRVVCEIRRIIRQFSVPTIIVIDIPYGWGLQGTRYSRTLLKTVKAVKNLALYENCLLIEKRASGKRCPLCNNTMREYKKTRRTRLYQCKQCNVVIDRDINSCYRLCLWILECFLRKPELTEVFREKIRSVKRH